MDTPHRQSIVAACQETILRVAAAADAGDASALAALFTVDAVLERPNAAPIHGSEAIRQVYASRSPERLTRHLVTNTLVDVIAPGESHATSLVLLWSGSMKDTAGPQGRPAVGRQMVGEFRDVLLATNEGWRIARRQALFVLHSNP
jgi:ketosteroid isomerase-like protein